MTDTKPRVLVVDDEPAIRELLELTLARMDLEPHAAADVAQARRLLSNGPAFALCLTDMRLPDGSGIEIVEHIQQHAPATPVAVITAHGSVETAVEAMKKGAFDFISKPVELKPLRELVHAALKAGRAGACTGQKGSPLQLVGCSPAIESIRQQIPKLGRSQAPVLITGETGTGKELVARLIHQNSPRCDAPFVPVNCGAIPSELMESEFFGHKRGSFTGAHADKAGLFQAAHGGTLFLDEVAELPLPMQVKLLRALQERAVRPVGATTEQPVDVRVISATHRDLGAWLGDGRFRSDLYYRLNVIPLHIPPLRERREDIECLTHHALKRYGKNTAQAVATDSFVIAQLTACDLSGNVRELENILHRWLTLGELAIPAMTAKSRSLPASITAHSTQPDPVDTNSDAIRLALEATRWNRTKAAQQLGITLRQLRYRMQRLGLK
jgi:two-component system response regulator PilR (NtrC family)